MRKFNEAEKLLDLILDQFNPTLVTSNAMGEFKVNWTDCFDARCTTQPSKFDKDACKQGCIISAASSSVAEIAGSRSKCGAAKNPNSCIKKLDKAIKNLREKISEAREKQREALDKKAEYLRKTAGGA